MTLMTLMFLLWGSLQAGAVLSRLLRVDFGLIECFASGFGICLFYLFGLGVFGYLTLTAAISFATISCLLNFSGQKKICLEMQNVAANIGSSFKSLPKLTMCFIAMSAATALLLMAMTNAEPWALTLQFKDLSIARYWVETGRVEHLPHTPYVGLSAFGLLSLSFGYLAGGSFGANLLAGFIFGNLSLVVLFQIARQWLNPQGAITACIIAMFIPEAIYGFSIAKTDLVWTFFQLLSFKHFILALKDGERSDVGVKSGQITLDRATLTCALFAGLSFAIKQHGGFHIFFVCLSLVFFRIFYRARISFKSVFLFLSIGVALAVLPYAYNYWHYKNPFFPVLTTVFSRFGGLPFDWFILQHKTNFGVYGFFRLLWDMSVNVEFAYTASRLVGPIILAASPVGVAMLWKYKYARVILFYFLFELIHWFFLKTHVRHIFPHLFLMTIFSAAALVGQAPGTSRYQLVGNVGFAGFLVYSLCNVSFIYAAPIRGGIGLLSKAEQISAMTSPQIPSLPVREFFSDPKRRGDVVCHICESGYFISYRKLSPSYYTGERSLLKIPSLAQVMVHLRRNNIHYVLYNDFMLSIWSWDIPKCVLDDPIFWRYLKIKAVGEYDRLYQIDWSKWDREGV